MFFYFSDTLRFISSRFCFLYDLLFSYLSTESRLHNLIVNETQQGLTIKGSRIGFFNVESSNSKGTGLTVDISRTTSKLELSKLNLTRNSENGVYIIGDSFHSNENDLDSTSSEESILIMTGCVISNNTLNGIHITSSARIEIRNCSVKNNIKTGIKLQQIDSGFLLIENSVISNNSEYAIHGYITKGVAVLSSLVSDHKYGYYTYWGYWNSRVYVYLNKQSYSGNTSIVFKDSKFVNNIADGLQIIFEYSSGRTDLTVEANHFYGGNKTLHVRYYSYNWATSSLVGEIRDNVIENSFYIPTENEKLLEIFLGSNSKLDISNNRFLNNTVGTGIYITQSTSSTKNIIIQENQFVENNFSRTIIDIAEQLLVKLSRNVFKGSFTTTNGCILKTPLFDVEYSINATHNYWGASDFKDVVESICGFDSDFERAFVWYTPYYADDSLLTLSEKRQNDFNVSGVFGGDITGDLTIQKSSDLQIGRSVFIR